MKIFDIKPADHFRLGHIPLLAVDNISSQMECAARLAIFDLNANWRSYLLSDHIVTSEKSGTINLFMKRLSIPIDNDVEVDTEAVVRINDVLSKGFFETLTVVKDPQNDAWEQMVVHQKKQYKASNLVFSESATNAECIRGVLSSFDPIHLESVNFSYLADPVTILRGQVRGLQ